MPSDPPSRSSLGDTPTRPFTYSNGTLTIDGLPLSLLAAEFGTPLYVYSAANIRHRLELFERAFAPIPHTVCYAVKASSSLAILQLLGSLGAGFDIVSGGELERVRRACPQALRRVVFSGVGKQAWEIDAALAADILLFNVESTEELDLLAARAAALGKQARFALRVNPDVFAETHPYISTGLREHKFGIDISLARDLYRYATRHPSLVATGVSVHIGSQIQDVGPFAEALTRVATLIHDLRADGHTISHIDLGGGLGIDYLAPLTSSSVIPALNSVIPTEVERPAFAHPAPASDLDSPHQSLGRHSEQTEEPPHLFLATERGDAPETHSSDAVIPTEDEAHRTRSRGTRISAELTSEPESQTTGDPSPSSPALPPEQQVASYAQALLPTLATLDCHLLLEPGRFLIAQAGALLTRVLGTKQNGSKRFVITDAAMNDLIRPALYQAHHEILPVAEQQGSAAPAQTVDIVGPVCESGDFFAHDRPLPPLASGDLLLLLDAGAYGMSQASNYNTRTRPAELLIDSGHAHLIRRRETLDDLLATEVLL